MNTAALVFAKEQAGPRANPQMAEPKLFDGHGCVYVQGDACRYAHGGDGAFADAKKWIEDRKRRRRLLAAAEGDPHAAEDDPLATKAHRASKFCGLAGAHVRRR